MQNYPGVTDGNDYWMVYRFKGAMNKLSFEVDNSNAYIRSPKDLLFQSSNSFSSTSPALIIRRVGGIGIATSTPNNKLDIYSTTKSAIGFSGASGDTFKWTIGMDVSDKGKFKIASSTALGTLDRLVIDGAGNVSVGGKATTTQAGVFSPGRYPTGSTPTYTSNEEGGFLWNSTKKKTCVCDGSIWVEATSTVATACF